METLEGVLGASQDWKTVLMIILHGEIIVDLPLHQKFTYPLTN